MIGVQIKIDDKATPCLERFMKKEVGKIIAKEVNKQLVEQMKSRVPYWKGNLMKSIQGYETKQGYNIHMNFYGPLLERGHFIPPVKIPYLWNWAFSKLGKRAWFFLAHQMKWGHRVLPGGYRGQLFIQPSIDYVLSNIDSTSINIINKALKESGFK